MDNLTTTRISLKSGISTMMCDVHQSMIVPLISVMQGLLLILKTTSAAQASCLKRFNIIESLHGCNLTHEVSTGNCHLGDKTCCITV